MLTQTMMMTGMAFLTGAVTWLLAEYLLHRFVGHGHGNSDFADEHRRHHAVGNYFAPTAKKARHVTPVVVVVGTVLGVMAGMPGVAYAVGFALMYVAYEVLHRRLHTHGPTGPVSRFLRRHHFWHHYHDPRSNHGVTTPVWDMLWRTRQVPTRIVVPVKLAPHWLLDPATGDVAAAYSEDYVLLRRPAARAEPRPSNRAPAAAAA